MSRLLGIAFKSSEVPQFDGFAKALGIPFDVILLGQGYQGTSGAEHIFSVGSDEAQTADTIDTALSDFAKSYSHISAISSMSSKDLLPRIAAKLDGAMVTDVIAALSVNEFRRPLQAGSVIGTVQVLATPVIITFRPANFEKVSSASTAPNSDLSLAKSTGSKVIGTSGGSGSRPDLSQAKFVISGGRPLKDAETFEKVIGGFADAFGGAVGATRAAVDAGIAPNETQVGQTGKIVAPDLYIAAGISGSTQHMAGIKDSKLIVAINKDPDAPIFEAADLGMVGDLYDVLPELQIALRKDQP